MKNKNLKFVVCILPCILLMSSCIRPRVNEPDLATVCSEKSEAVIETGNAFLSNMNSTTCQAYKDALTDYVDRCQHYELYNPGYQDALDDWDCDEYK